MPIKDPEERKRKQREYSARYYANNKELSIARTKAQHKKQKAKWGEYKDSLSCITCGFGHPAVIDFHHVDPATKTASVNVLVANRRYGAAREEIKKCVPLCANCHRIHHYNKQKGLPCEEPFSNNEGKP
tara:strand:- start:1252 stop:1638 length:387 start_codon:yes stop_codon:yes gene_type:complete